MSKQVTLENTLAGGFGLPTGQMVPGNGSVVVEPEIWAAAKDHPVVKARLDAGTLVVDGRGKGPAPAANRDENGDTPEMAELRRMFDASYKRQGDALTSAQTELTTLTGRVTDLESQVNAKDYEIAALKTGDGAGGGKSSTDTTPNGPLTVKETSSGWYAVVDAEGKPVTKNFRKDDLAGFDSMSNEDKAAFVDLH